MLSILIRPEAKADIYTTELGQAIDSLVNNPKIGFTRILGKNMYVEKHI